MNILLFTIPLIALASGLAIYHRNGRREILKFDLVQFIYAFVLAPILFVWLKTFLFIILRNELGITISITNLFVWDTVFSLIFMVVYASVVIHSLTKSFENKRYKDPLFDVFQHSESIHLWVSHTATYAGVMMLLTLVSIINIFFPLYLQLNKLQFYLLLSSGVLLGGLGLAIIWLSIFKEKFWLVNKLLFGLFFIIHVLAYYFLKPSFNADHAMYWIIFSTFTTTVVLAFGLEKSDKASNLLEKLAHKSGWSHKNKKYLLAK